MSKDRLLSDEDLREKLGQLNKCVSGEHEAWDDDVCITVSGFIDLINTQKKLYAESVKETLIKMLDALGVEKCPVCSEHLIDDDMNICENCNYGVHEWCTGYTYKGDGEYPAESAYAICKSCYKQDALRVEQRQRVK